MSLTDTSRFISLILRHKPEAIGITLDEHGEIKGGDDAIAGLKTQHPVQFASASEQREIQPHKLAGRDQSEGGITKAEFLRKPYAERVAFANDNPEAYQAMMNK